MSALSNISKVIEQKQVVIYSVFIFLGAVIGVSWPDAGSLEKFINWFLAIMLFSTFLQVPIGDLWLALRNVRFLLAILVSNFILVPIFCGLLIQLLLSELMIRLGVLMVLLTPCVDYVVTFTHLGKGNSRLLLATTPILLIAQIVLLPFFLALFLGSDTRSLIQSGPFIHAFVFLIVIPLFFAMLIQIWEKRSRFGLQVGGILKVMPVPSTATVLFIVVAAVSPRIQETGRIVIQTLPAYVGFAVVAPLLGWIAARLFTLQPEEGRALAFSTATRNSLVVLPLSYTIPNGYLMLPAIIVTQTLVELICELIYIKIIPFIFREHDNTII